MKRCDSPKFCRFAAVSGRGVGPRFTAFSLTAAATLGGYGVSAVEAAEAAEPVHAVIDDARPLHAISPLIYGSNHEVEGYEFGDARRLGGNRLTPYNWEVDASNAGKDYQHQHDRWLSGNTWWHDLGEPETARPAGTPAASVLRFHDESLQRGAYSLVTVPLAGFVAADAEGPVGEDEAAPSPRWARTAADSEGAAMSLDDGRVYADQLVAHLTERYGKAGTARGIGGYSLDNEPALWHKTHPRLHPEQVTCQELLNKSIATAQAVKSVDPGADVFGPALWGMTAYATLSNAADWDALREGEGYDWFIDAYLDRMREASDRAGHRLLDVLDVHWYTENPKGRAWTGPEVAQAAKVLYEPGFAEDNWVGQHFARFLPLLPKMQASVDRYFPGTKLALTEYDWPQTDTVYGGLAQADALGAMGRHGVYFASYHHYSWEKPDRYVGSAFALYRNADGRGLAFGDTALPVQLAGGADVSVYAARDDAGGSLHVIAINREDRATPLRLELTSARPDAAEAWFFDGQDPAPRAADPASVGLAVAADGVVSLELPAYSAWHVRLRLAD